MHCVWNIANSGLSSEIWCPWFAQGIVDALGVAYSGKEGTWSFLVCSSGLPLVMYFFDDCSGFEMIPWDRALLSQETASAAGTVASLKACETLSLHCCDESSTHCKIKIESNF